MAEPAHDTRPDVVAEVRTKGDFPAAARVLQRLNESVRREDCKTNVVARTILQDPGLSSKILRVVNSALYRHRGDPVATISRAVILLGFDAIRDLTASVLLMEQLLPRGRGAGPVRDGFARALRCGLVAQAISARVGHPHPEEAYLLGLFANLGTLWLAAHYPDRFAEALAGIERDGALDASIRRVFGLRPADLAACILDEWGFPKHYASYFRTPPARARALDPDAKLAAVVGLAADYTSGDVPLDVLEARFHELFGLPPEQLVAATRAGEQAFREQAPGLGIVLPKPAPRAPDGGAPRVDAEPAASRAGAGDVPSALAVLAEITQATLAGENINDVLSMVIEGLARTGGYDSVLLALLTPARDRIVGRLGVGEGVEQFLRTMVVPLRPGSGALADAILSHQPRLVASGSAADLVPRGSATGGLRVASFIVFPLVVRQREVGAILAARGAPPPIGERDLAVVQLFGNHASLALDRAAG